MDKENITSGQFNAYLKIQKSGKYNMIMDADKAAREAGLSMACYFSIIHNYKYLAMKFKENLE